MKQYFDLNKNLIHEGHVFDGTGTLITNFNNEQLERYTNTIIDTGMEDSLIISPFAYNCYGDLLEGHCSLHALERLEMMDFWEEFKIH